jgi:hypothetical protein
MNLDMGMGRQPDRPVAEGGRTMNERMRHLKSIGLGVLALAALVALDSGQMNQARAGVRVHARLQLPNLTVHYRNVPERHDRAVVRTHHPFVYRVTARDRSIARRLSYRTGHRTIVLLDLRARGLGWQQIGRRLDIPRGIVRQAIRAGSPVRIGSNGSCCARGCTH